MLSACTRRSMANNRTRAQARGWTSPERLRRSEITSSLSWLLQRFDALDQERGEVGDALDTRLLTWDAIGRGCDRPGEAFYLVEPVADVERRVCVSTAASARCGRSLRRSSLGLPALVQVAIAL
jgi:hypothetical protein